MRCAWQALLDLLPTWMRNDVDKHGRDTLQEIRLRSGYCPMLILEDRSLSLKGEVTREDLQYIINLATQYSPWAAETVARGYITTAGGHRIGLCGEMTTDCHGVTCLKVPTSLCIRVSRDFVGIGRLLEVWRGSVLIIGSPGSGKTTLLRDMIRNLSDTTHMQIVTVDEREEIFPRYQDKFCFPPGKNTDVISGCKKTAAIDMVLRSMGANIIAMDEITASEDCEALLQAGWCGVQFIATAHAGSIQELYQRPIYQPILKKKLFTQIVAMNPDKSWVCKEVDC